MTPAEQIAAANPRRPRGRPRPVLWNCTIKAKRKALGLSLSQAAASGVSVAAICAAEQGKDPQLSTARKLAAFFGCTVEDLWPTLLPPTVGPA